MVKRTKKKRKKRKEKERHRAQDQAEYFGYPEITRLVFFSYGGDGRIGTGIWDQFKDADFTVLLADKFIPAKSGH